MNIRALAMRCFVFVALALPAASEETQSVMEGLNPGLFTQNRRCHAKSARSRSVQRSGRGNVGLPRFEVNALTSAPWRSPLLYESGPQGREVNGIRIYREDDSRVVDWHVHWMTKYGSILSCGTGIPPKPPTAN